MSSKLLCIAALLPSAALSVWNASAESPPLVRTAVMASFFEGVPKPMVQIATEAFATTLHEATGVSCRLDRIDDAFDLAQRLDDGRLQFGVFHGVEYAWVRHKYPQLTPLLVAVSKAPGLRANLVVRKDSNIADFNDLADKDIAVPGRLGAHCRLFLKKLCAENSSGDEGSGVPNVVAAANVEAALDSLATGKVHAVVTSEHGLEFYRDLKPGCFGRLQVIRQSATFPPHVVVYRPSKVDDATVGRIRTGLARLPRLASGRELLKQWKVQAFEPPPRGFIHSLVEIEKSYPAPDRN